MYEGNESEDWLKQSSLDYSKMERFENSSRWLETFF